MLQLVLINYWISSSHLPGLYFIVCWFVHILIMRLLFELLFTKLILKLSNIFAVSSKDNAGFRICLNFLHSRFNYEYIFVSIQNLDKMKIYKLLL